MVSKVNLIQKYKKKRHSWKPIEGSRKFRHSQCRNCPAEKWWDPDFGGRFVYQSLKGITYLAPKCEK